MQLPGSPDPATPVAEAQMLEQAVHDLGPRWRLRFWMIFSGQALSLVGSALTQFVLLWWITDTTGSVSALATAGMAALLPQALLSPLGGTFADRYSRRLLMIAADVISALCMAVLIVLFLTERIELWHAYVMMFIRSAMQAFQTPAATASMAMLVPRDFLPRAAGLNQSLQSFTVVAAAPLGALAISVMPMGWALGIDVGTALLGIVPLLIKEHFNGGAPQVALMEGLAGIGMVLGGMVVAALAPRRQVPWVLWGFAASCLALALTGLVPGQLFGVAVAWWVLSGFTFILGNAPLTALLQATIPNQLQGRALSLLAMAMGLAAPVGLALATPLGEWIGIRWLFVLMGVAGTLVSLAGFLSPPLRKLDMEQRS